MLENLFQSDFWGIIAFQEAFQALKDLISNTCMSLWFNFICEIKAG